jgi:hypothetical protein
MPAPDTLIISPLRRSSLSLSLTFSPPLLLMILILLPLHAIIHFVPLMIFSSSFRHFLASLEFHAFAGRFSAFRCLRCGRVAVHAGFFRLPSWFPPAVFRRLIYAISPLILHAIF